MKLKIIIAFFSFVAVSLFLIGAGTTADKPVPIKFVIPKGFPKPASDIFKNNLLTEEGFQLGKKLFYDPKLSKDGQVSCASCHQQFAAFATYDHDFSHGINNSFSTRNAPAIINIAWMKAWHWDGGINHPEVQPLSPLSAPNEMGESLDTVIMKIKSDPTYRILFQKAFGDPTINTQKMLKALSQFTGSLVSADSKYDKVKRGEATFIEPEEKGYAVFKANCNTCHREPLFTDNDFHNNGLGSNRFHDAGRAGVTGDVRDSFKFKVPTLRNIGLTVPYMHDGRFNTLDKILAHYTMLDTSAAGLDPLLRKKITMTEKEKNSSFFFCTRLPIPPSPATNDSHLNSPADYLLLNKRFSIERH